MNLSQILTPDEILLGFDVPDKWTAIRTMADVLCRTGRLPQAMGGAAKEALLQRERRMTTGMEDGIAIPHAALADLPELIGVLAIAPDGIPFETLDGEPARILVCMLTPKRDKLLHIRTLAEIARLLSDEGVRERICRCETPAAVLDTIRAAE